MSALTDEFGARLASLGGQLHPVLVPVPADAAPRSKEQVRLQRAASRAALARCAEIVGGPRDGWKQDGNRVPLPNAGFHWSVTHKRCWAGAVISNEPVGIDLEQLVPRRRRTHGHVASGEEWVLAGPDTWHTFYRVWTAKEATLKSHGRGIGMLRQCVLLAVPGPGRMVLEYDGQASQVEHHRHDGHLAAVTCNCRAVAWHVCTNVDISAVPARGEGDRE